MTNLATVDGLMSSLKLFIRRDPPVVEAAALRLRSHRLWNQIWFSALVRTASNGFLQRALTVDTKSDKCSTPCLIVCMLFSGRHTPCLTSEARSQGFSVVEGFSTGEQVTGSLR